MNANRHPGKRERSFWFLGGCLAAGLGVAVLLVSALPGVGQPEPIPQLPDPNKVLAEAEAAAPYVVKLPASLPPGATLQQVIWDRDVGGVVVIDVWFALSAGGRLHMWQTNTTSPIQSIPDGEALVIGELTWNQVPVAWGAESLLQLNTRFEDGVTVTVDAPVASLDPQALVDVAASIG